VKYGHQIRPRVCWLSAHSSHSSRRGGLADSSSSSSFSFLLSRFFLNNVCYARLQTAPMYCTVYCAYMYSALIWPGSNCHWRCTFLIFLLLFTVVLALSFIVIAVLCCLLFYLT
jgi:hypothetical protein